MGTPNQKVVRRWERRGYMTVATIAFFSGHHVQTVYSWIRRGHLKGHVVRDGGLVFVRACRWTTKPAQMHNTRQLMATNTSGAREVSWSKVKRKWVARIINNGHTKALGAFGTVAEASAAYQFALDEIHKREIAESVFVQSRG